MKFANTGHKCDYDLLGWAVLRIYVALIIFQSYPILEAGETQSLKFKWQDQEWNPGTLASQATSLNIRPSLLPIMKNWIQKLNAYVHVRKTPAFMFLCYNEDFLLLSIIGYGYIRRGKGVWDGFKAIL